MHVVRNLVQLGEVALKSMFFEILKKNIDFSATSPNCTKILTTCMRRRLDYYSMTRTFWTPPQNVAVRIRSFLGDLSPGWPISEPATLLLKNDECIDDV